MRSVFPHLSKPQVKVLAEYSLGMVLAGRCGLPCVACALARWLSQTFDAVRERLRDWYCGAADKSGSGRGGRRKRRDLDVNGCFAPLLQWVLRDWKDPHLAIALDATTLGERFVVLAVSVMYRACAIPVAWVVLPATRPGAWKPHWLSLLAWFKDAVPSHLTVIVLADRGPYARWLFRAIVACGWHPFLRVNTTNAEFEPDEAAAAAGRDGAYVPLASLLPGVGSAYDGPGTMFRSAEARLPCTLLARWDDGYEQGWFVVTDLSRDRASVAWYGLRSWIERGFEHAKSGGWNWQETRMTDPGRARRQWLAMAAATVLLVRQGATAETTTAQPPPPPPPPLPPTPTPTPTPTPEKSSGPVRSRAAPLPEPTHRPRRTLSVFRKGLLAVQAALLSNLPMTHAPFVPAPWPQHTPTQQSPATVQPP